MGLFLNKAGTLVTENTKKAGLLNAFCPSVFTDKTSAYECLTWDTREKEWWKEDFHFVEEDWVRDHLGQLDVQKSLDHDGVHL